MDSPYDDPRMRIREQRIRAIIASLLPTLRRVNPTMPDDQLIDLAESMAEVRLSDEDIG